MLGPRVEGSEPQGHTDSSSPGVEVSELQGPTDSGSPGVEVSEPHGPTDSSSSGAAVLEILGVGLERAGHDSSRRHFRGSATGSQASGSGNVYEARFSPRPDVQVGGSSGSGEKPVPKELTYEDFFEEGEGSGAAGD